MENKVNKKIVILAIILLLVPFNVIISFIHPIFGLIIFYAAKIIGLILLCNQSKFFSKTCKTLFKVTFILWIVYLALSLSYYIIAKYTFVVFLISLLNTLIYSSNFILTIILTVFIFKDSNLKNVSKKADEKEGSNEDNKKDNKESKIDKLSNKKYFAITNKKSIAIIIIAAILTIVPFSLIIKGDYVYIAFYLPRIIGFMLWFTQYRFFTKAQKVLFKVIICLGFLFAISDFYLNVLPHHFNTFGDIGLDYVLMLLVYGLTLWVPWILSIVLNILLFIPKKEKEESKNHINI